MIVTVNLVNHRRISKGWWCLALRVGKGVLFECEKSMNGDDNEPIFDGERLLSDKSNISCNNHMTAFSYRVLTLLLLEVLKRAGRTSGVFLMARIHAR